MHLNRWRVVRSAKIANITITITTTTRSPNGNERICSEGMLYDGYPPLNSTEKLAYGDLDDSVLTLYGADFQGKPLIVGEDGINKTEAPFTVGSWALTGTQGFTVFDEEDFKGNSTCLDAEKSAKDAGYGISVECTTRLNFNVSSVKFGCDDNITSIITGNPEIMSLSWDDNGNEIKEFEKVELMPNVIVI